MTRPLFEPEVKGFDGIYIGSKSSDFTLPPNDIDLSGITRFMRETNKEFIDLTEEEINEFRFHST